MVPGTLLQYLCAHCTSQHAHSVADKAIDWVLSGMKPAFLKMQSAYL